MNKDSRGTCKHKENQRLIRGTPSYFFLLRPFFVRIPSSVGQEGISDSRALLVHSSILSNMISLDLCLSISFFLFALHFYLKKANPYSSLPLPPGPKGWPIIGNFLDMPTEFEWKTYHEWCKKFGAF